MKPSDLITMDLIKVVEQRGKFLCETIRWRGKGDKRSCSNKLEYEAFVLMTFGFLKDIMLPDPKPDMTALPAYVLKRFFRKSSTWDSKPENREDLSKRVREIDGRYGEYPYLIERYTWKKLEEEGFSEFASYIWKEAARLPKDVEEVFNASKAIANFIEYELMDGKFEDDVSDEIRQRIYNDLEVFYKMPHFIDIIQGLGEYRGLKKLLKKIASSGRNTDRWQGLSCVFESSILAHMYETALIGYLANLELERETDILQDFWTLLYHDIPEIWTDDVQTPVKDGMEIAPGITLRKLTEEQERYVMTKYFYPVIPECCVPFFNGGMMLEDIDDKERHKFFKMADYFSADFEVLRNIRKGTRDYEFFKVLSKSTSSDKYRTPAQREWLNYRVDQCSKIVFVD